MKQLTQTALRIKYTAFSNFENIHFRYVRGQCLEIGSSWELYFSYLNFRSVFNQDGAIIRFKQRDYTAHPAANITATSFDYIMIEGFKGIPFICESYCDFAHSHFGTINIEDYAENITPDCTYGVVTDENFNAATVIHLPIFQLNERAQFSAIDINNLELNNYALRYFTINNQQYTYDTVMDMKYCPLATPVFNNVEVIGTGKDLILLHYNEDQCDRNTSFTVNNFTTNNIKYKPIFDVYGFSKINSGFEIPHTSYNGYLYGRGKGYTPFYTVATTTADRNFSNLYYDAKCLNNLQLAVRTLNTIEHPSQNRIEVKIPVTGKIFNMRWMTPLNNIGNLGIELQKDNEQFVHA